MLMLACFWNLRRIFARFRTTPQRLPANIVEELERVPHAGPKEEGSSVARTGERYT